MTLSRRIAKGSIPAWAGETSGGSSNDKYRTVYPRVGGGNVRRLYPVLDVEGLSPRGRGKPQPTQFSTPSPGSIPAWAGETDELNAYASPYQVYPRVGGGNRQRSRIDTPRPGLSPRGRGKLSVGYGRVSECRSIPAWAGETSSNTLTLNVSSVYPRVGGGNIFVAEYRLACVGLSPRGRGKRRPDTTGDRGGGSIPAWAGETQSIMSGAPMSRVYPRVGGGNSVSYGVGLARNGLSPRGRGKPPPMRIPRPSRRSIPAWAGETRLNASTASRASVYPRVGGGNKVDDLSVGSAGGLSPRGRGKPPAPRTTNCYRRSIPAWAGETFCRRSSRGDVAVYPRVGGGNNAQSRRTIPSGGLSPRGRGKHRAVIAYAKRRRSIPAWAGETAAGGAIALGGDRPHFWRAGQALRPVPPHTRG